MGYEISRRFFVHSRYPAEVGYPLEVLDQPCGVVNQVDLVVLLTVGTRAGLILGQVGDAHFLTIRYEVLSDVGQQTDPIRILGDHVSVLPA